MQIETEENKTTSQLQDLLIERAKLIGGRPWGAAQLRPRIYLPTRKDVTAFFEFRDFAVGGDSPPYLGGAGFRVSIEDCGQHSNWYKSQRQKIVASNWRRSLALSAYDLEPRLARAIMDGDQELSAEMVDTAAHELVNGRWATVCEILGCQLPDEQP